MPSCISKMRKIPLMAGAYIALEPRLQDGGWLVAQELYITVSALRPEGSVVSV